MATDLKEPEPLQVPIKTAAIMLGCCRQTLYKMRADNQIAFGRMRERTMVPMAEIKRVHALLYPGGSDASASFVGDPKKRRTKKIKLFPSVTHK